MNATRQMAEAMGHSVLLVAGCSEPLRLGDLTCVFQLVVPSTPTPINAWNRVVWRGWSGTLVEWQDQGAALLAASIVTVVRPRTNARCWRISVPKCSLSKYGFRASGVRTGESAHRAETGLLPTFLRSVLKRPSQEVRRELASGERFSGFSGPGQSTGLPRKPQETCHSAGRWVGRRVRLVWELAERVGFEPTVPLRVLRFSRPTRSTTLPPLRGALVIGWPAV